MSRKLSNESSLENLKREAKRWLRALRENDPAAEARLTRSSKGNTPTPTLRDVQRALAIEYGFDGWISLSRAALLIAQTRRLSGGKQSEPTQFGESAERNEQTVLLLEFLQCVSEGDVPNATRMLDEQAELIDRRGALDSDTGLRTALHFAIGAPNANQMVDMLLKRGANPNIRDERDNAYPLHFVAEQENLVLLESLVNHGADLDGSGDYHELGIIGWATVFARGTEAARALLSHGAKHTLPSAVTMGDTDMIHDLAQHQIPRQLQMKLDAANRHRTLLHLAVVKNQPDSLKTLLSLGADVEAVDVAGLTALDQAALDGRLLMAEQLIEAGARVELPAAIALERLDDVQRILHTDINQLKVGHKYGQLIVQASERAPRSLIRLLLRCGADVHATAHDDAAVDNTVGYTALHAAAFHGNADAVDELLKAGANPRAREERYCSTPTGWARHGKQQAIVARLLQTNIDMFDAVEFDMSERIREIAARDPGALRRRLGAYVRCTPTEEAPWKNPNKSPLEAAREWRSVNAEKVLGELLEATDVVHGERVSRFLTNASLDWRTASGGIDIRKARNTADRLLMQHPEIATENIYTAVVCGNLNLVEELLNADVALANQPGGPRNWPPLLYLANARLSGDQLFDSSVEIARLLLDRGADPNAFCPGGIELIGYDENGVHYTVLTCVLGMGEPQAPPHPYSRELAALLMTYGAEPYDPQVQYNIFADHGSRRHLTGDIVWLLQLTYDYSVGRGRADDWKDPKWEMLSLGGYGPAAYFLLGAAINRKLLRFAEWMLQHGAGPNVRSTHPRFNSVSLYELAIHSGNTSMQELLARYGANTTVQISTSAYDEFIGICMAGDAERARGSIAAHPEWLRDSRALFAATRQDNAEAVKLLLECGVSPDVEESWSRARALHAAGFAGSARAAQVLLDAGADADFREMNYGSTPMGAAAWAQQQQVIDVLTPYSRDLFNLVAAGKVSRVREVLREEPALAKAIHPRKNESLLMALPDNEDDAVTLAELLIANGADTSFRDAHGSTAEEMAERRAMPRVAALMTPPPPTVADHS